MIAKEFRLKNKLSRLTRKFDYIIFDCPPSFGSLTMNAMMAASEILMPLQLGYFNLEGINSFIDSINQINQHLSSVANNIIKISGVLITFYDPQTSLSKRISKQLEELFGNKILKTRIPKTIRLDEAQCEQKSIFDYDPGCKGAIAYQSLTQEIINQSSTKNKKQEETKCLV